MPKQTPPDVREIEEFWRNGQDARAFGESATQRERLLIELVYAARSLANHAIRRRPAGMNTSPLPGEERVFQDCRECGRIAPGDAPIQHKPSCKTGRVMSVLDQIQALIPANVAKGESQGGGL